ncbi:MAG: hypothetical protein QF659_01420 [Dehalococcoidia bacterium]|nr:hypothetical protein [Dehalococcoidia bacterium]
MGVGSGLAAGVGSAVEVGATADGGAGLGVEAGFPAGVGVEAGVDVDAGVEVGTGVGAGDGPAVGVWVAVAAGTVAELVGCGACGVVTGAPAGAEGNAWVEVGAGCAQATISKVITAIRPGMRHARKPVSFLLIIGPVDLARGSPKVARSCLQSARSAIWAVKARPAGAGYYPVWLAKGSPPAGLALPMVSEVGPEGAAGITTRRIDEAAVASSDSRPLPARQLNPRRPAD